LQFKDDIMATAYTEEKVGPFGRVRNWFFGAEEEFVEEPESHFPPKSAGANTNQPMRPDYRYVVTLRTQVTNLTDAAQVANGLKIGEQQIVNLENTPDTEKRDIINFLAGVNYAMEGTMEAITPNVILFVPATAHLQPVPPNERSSSVHN
jgi:cell division inhibitor SepF